MKFLEKSHHDPLALWRNFQVPKIEDFLQESWHNLS
jgi:hypothetical protein